MNMMQKPSLGGVWERISCKESWIYNLRYFEGLGSRNCKLKYSYIKSLTQLCKQCTVLFDPTSDMIKHFVGFGNLETIIK